MRHLLAAIAMALLPFACLAQNSNTTPKSVDFEAYWLILQRTYGEVSADIDIVLNQMGDLDSLNATDSVRLADMASRLKGLKAKYRGSLVDYREAYAGYLNEVNDSLNTHFQSYQDSVKLEFELLRDDLRGQIELNSVLKREMRARNLDAGLAYYERVLAQKDSADAERLAAEVRLGQARDEVALWQRRKQRSDSLLAASRAETEYVKDSMALVMKNTLETVKEQEILLNEYRGTNFELGLNLSAFMDPFDSYRYLVQFDSTITEDTVGFDWGGMVSVVVSYRLDQPSGDSYYILVNIPLANLNLGSNVGVFNERIPIGFGVGYSPKGWPVYFSGIMNFSSGIRMSDVAQQRRDYLEPPGSYLDLSQYSNQLESTPRVFFNLGVGVSLEQMLRIVSRN